MSGYDHIKGTNPTCSTRAQLIAAGLVKPWPTLALDDAGREAAKLHQEAYTCWPLAYQECTVEQSLELDLRYQELQGTIQQTW